MDVRHAVGVKAGIPAAKLAALSRYETDPAFSERERAALSFAEQVTRGDRPVSDECGTRLRRHFSESEVVELTFIAGFQTFASKFATAFDLSPQGFSS